MGRYYDCHVIIIRLSLILLAIFPIIPKMNISSIIIFFVLGLVILISCLEKKNTFKKEDYIFFILPSIFFLLDMISFIQSNNETIALKVFSRNILYFVYGYIFMLITKFKYIKFNYALIITVFSYSVLILSVVFFLYWRYKFYNNLIKDFNWDIRIPLQDIMDCHGTYYALFVGISVLIFFKKILLSNSFFLKIYYMIIVCFLCVIQYKTMADMPFLGTLLGILFIFIIRFHVNHKIKILIFSLIFSLTIVVGFKVFLDLRDKNNYYLMSLSRDSDYLNFDKTRVVINNSSINAYLKFSITEKVLGTGTGDVQYILNDEYKNFTAIFDRRVKYDTHNQYNHMLLSYGFFGLIVFACSLIYITIIIFNYSYKEFDLYASMIALFLIAFTTETVLVRQHGIMIFSIIVNLFLMYSMFKIRETQ